MANHTKAKVAREDINAAAERASSRLSSFASARNKMFSEHP